MTTTDVRTVDVIVIGGGPVGENAAGRTAAAGLETVLVESELYGGECSYWACMPSKALLRPLEALAAARRVPGAAQAITGSIDVDAVLARRTSFTSDWDDSSQAEWVESAGILALRGHGRIVGERLVSISPTPLSDLEDEVTLQARHAVIVATGSVPAEPPIDGLATIDHWGSREATAAQDIPERLIVLGGGVVGAELAQAFVGLGSQVTLIAGASLLGRMEDFAGELVAASLREQGVDLRMGVQATAVESTDAGVRVTLEDGATLDAEQLLVATGRRPATDDIGAETVGLTPGDALSVDDQGAVEGVSDSWLYAVGDVNGRAPLTHQGKHQARIVSSVIATRAAGGAVDTGAWSAHSLVADHRAVPQVVFTDPQATSVGRTAAQAGADGIRTRVIDLDIAVAGSALHADGYTGKARFVVDEDAGVLVGVTMVGQDVAELIHSATVAVVGEVPVTRLWHAVPSFPTISEVWLRFGESYGL
ncbi:MAG: NAD(P)/FAD-dependent oxidoreductase [Actinomycetota bacterium]|nr:NAD(P)/FAD-dependent oxidoreductase [Actinomycetota bacterium]